MNSVLNESCKYICSTEWPHPESAIMALVVHVISVNLGRPHVERLKSEQYTLLCKLELDWVHLLSMFKGDPKKHNTYTV